MAREIGDYAVVVEGLVKRVKGRIILRGITLRVPRGSVFVLAGPNGSGKTTTIRTLLGLYRADEGSIEVLGVTPGSSDWKRVQSRIGYLPEDAEPYERLSGYENLLFYARLYATGREDLSSRYLENAIAISGLSREELARRAGDYSKGMKRRLLLATALMHDPELAVLDEPTTGLDVFSAYRIRGLIKELAGRGKTVIVTTHNMFEAQVIADYVAFIVEGTVIFSGRVSDALRAFAAGNLEEAFIRAAGRKAPQSVGS